VATQGIEWTFIPQLSPWMGGFYERMVALVKRSLKKSIGKVCLNFEQIRTILSEAQAVINSRPLTYVGSEFDERWTLCPADFLSLNPKTGIPAINEENHDDPDFRNEKMSSAEELLLTWKKGQSHLQQFWKLWYDDYLLNMRERTQRFLKGPRIQSQMFPQLGDIVLIKENLPRGTWKIAKIIQLNQSSDSHYRSAQLRLPNKKIFTRAVAHLYPLECAEPNVENPSAMDDAATIPDPTEDSENPNDVAVTPVPAPIRP